MDKSVINKDKHYFCLMHPLETFLGIITWTSSSTREKWVECEIVEDRYKVERGYKVTLKSIEPGYGRMDFYQMDFVLMLEDGRIIEKSSDDMHVEEITWYEPLCGAAYLVHSAYVVVQEGL